MQRAPTARGFALATLVAGGLAALVAACGDDGENPMGGDGVAAVEVIPQQTTLAVGQVLQFSASALDANGNEVSASFSWSSTDDSVVTVDDQGVATGEQVGTAMIVAAAEGVADSAQVEVTQPATVSSLERVSGGGQNGRTLRPFLDPLVVEVRDNNGNPVEDVTVEWSVPSGAVSLSSGTTTTGSSGQAEVTATSDTLLLEHEVRARVSTSEFTDSVSFSLETTAAYFEIGDNFFEDWQGRRNENFRADGNIAVGDSVIWDYAQGGTQHTVTSGEGMDGQDGDGVPSGGMGFGSGFLEPGDTFVWIPDAAGTWTYFCEVHPNTMFNSVIVVDEGDGSAARTASRDLEPGDVVRPEGSHLKFVYLGPPAEGR